MQPRSMGNPFRRLGIRFLPAIAAAIAIIAIVGATPASAAPYTVYTDGNAGSARFAKYGDHIYLCDHEEDNHSVVVNLEYTNEKGKYVEHDRWNWWGPYKYDGCKDVDLKVREDTRIYYQVCLGDHGHPGGKKGHVIKTSCSYWTWVDNDG